MIIMGDINKDVTLIPIKRFLIEVRLFDLHNHANLLNSTIDPTFIAGSKLINLVVISSEIFPFIIGSKLIEYNKLIPTDHRRIIFDFDIDIFLL